MIAKTGLPGASCETVGGRARDARHQPRRAAERAAHRHASRESRRTPRTGSEQHVVGADGARLLERQHDLLGADAHAKRACPSAGPAPARAACRRRRRVPSGRRCAARRPWSGSPRPTERAAGQRRRARCSVSTSNTEPWRTTRPSRSTTIVVRQARHFVQRMADIEHRQARVVAQPLEIGQDLGAPLRHRATPAARRAEVSRATTAAHGRARPGSSRRPTALRGRRWRRCSSPSSAIDVGDLACARLSSARRQPNSRLSLDAHVRKQPRILEDIAGAPRPRRHATLVALSKTVRPLIDDAALAAAGTCRRWR